MTPAERQRMRDHMRRYTMASGAQYASILIGLITAFWHGWPAVLCGIAAAVFFNLAKPEPDNELDRIARDE